MSRRELTANKDELTYSNTTYDYWAINSALSLALASGDHKRYKTVTDVGTAEEALLHYLTPISEDPGSLPALLSPERANLPTEDTADTARLVQALYRAATYLSVYIDANQYSVTILVIGEKMSVPNKYLISLTESTSDELTATNTEGLRRIYEAIQRKLISGT